MAGDDPETVTRERVEGERARISAAPDFVRAPVMRRLLDYLVAETLAGRGDTLKAYAVAVDGLGRAEDFDAQADSYPRVQVGRLRRMLDAFYARDGVVDDFRFNIPPGQYRVFFDPADASTNVAAEVVTGSETEPGDDSPKSSLSRWPWFAVLVAIVVVMLIGGALSLRDGGADATTSELTLPPVLRLAAIKTTPSMQATGQAVDATLVDGLRRSWLIRLHDERDSKVKEIALPRARRDALPSYRLTGEIGGTTKPQLQLRLANASTGQVLWSSQIDLPSDPAELRETLSPAMSELVQAYGVIATDERAVEGDRFAPGQRCVLEFDRYRRDRSKPVFTLLTRCLDRTLELDPGHAMALAAKSFIELDKSLYRFEPNAPDTARTAFALARRGVAADPYNAFTQLALGRAAQYSVGCGLTVRSVRQAIGLNPFDADLLGVSGVLLLNCGQPDGEALLRRSIALDANAPTPIRSWLIYAALDRGDVADAQGQLEDMPAPAAAGEGPAALLRATVAASAGNVGEARQIWARLWQLDPQIARDPNSLYERQNLPKAYRERSLAALVRAGLIPPASRPVATP
ncbi:hypothetical protein ACFB49_38270 [Sphingomonas sp. DBB INV C78]